MTTPDPAIPHLGPRPVLGVAALIVYVLGLAVLAAVDPTPLVEGPYYALAGVAALVVVEWVGRDTSAANAASRAIFAATQREDGDDTDEDDEDDEDDDEDLRVGAVSISLGPSNLAALACGLGWFAVYVAWNVWGGALPWLAYLIVPAPLAGALLVQRSVNREVRAILTMLTSPRPRTLDDDL